MAGLLVLPLACTSAAPDAEPADEHDAALQRWEAASLTDYQFDFQQECFCVREQVQPVTIEVRGGSITRVVSRETGEDVEDERLRWHTVRELFDVVTDARQQGVTPLNVEYDAELGYPTRIEAGSLAADAGVVYHASNLQPTWLSSAPTPAGCSSPVSARRVNASTSAERHLSRSFTWPCRCHALAMSVTHDGGYCGHQASYYAATPHDIVNAPVPG